MEAFLTLAVNGYADRDAADLKTPKLGNRSLRSLAIAENFQAGRKDTTRSGAQLADIGKSIASRADFDGFTNLNLAAESLSALIDRETTRQADKGRWLLYPFHASLLWYDARPQKAAGIPVAWSIRQVVMRGAGITVASMLADPRLPRSDEVLRGIE